MAVLIGLDRLDRVDMSLVYKETFGPSSTHFSSSIKMILSLARRYLCLRSQLLRRPDAVEYHRDFSPASITTIPIRTNVLREPL